MKGTGISEIALPQTFSGLLHRVNTAIEITTMIVAIERIVSSAIATTFAIATVFLSGGEGAPLRVLRSAGLCKGAPLKVLSLGRAVDQDRAPTNDRSISTLHHRVVPGQTDQIGGEIRDKCGGLESELGRLLMGWWGKCHLDKLLLLLPWNRLWSSRGGQLWQLGQAVHVDCVCPLVSLVANIDALCKARSG